MTDERFETLLLAALEDAQIREGIERSNASAAEIATEVRAAQSRIVRDAFPEIEAEDAAARDFVSASNAVEGIEARVMQRIHKRLRLSDLLLERAVRINLQRLRAAADERDNSTRRLLTIIDKFIPADVRGTTERPSTARKALQRMLLPPLSMWIVFVVTSALILLSGGAMTQREYWEVYGFEIGATVVIPTAVAILFIFFGSMSDLAAFRLAPSHLLGEVGLMYAYASEHERAEEELAKARLRLETRVIATERTVTRCVMAELRAAINAVLDAGNGLLLPALRPLGLAEVFDERYEIPTEAKRDVLRKLQTMPGGAIGIGGPRGAGKSTLLRSIANAVAEIDFGGEKRPVLGVLTAAPVQYDGREYLLHLFANTCARVLGTMRMTPRAEEGRPTRPAWTKFMPTVLAVTKPVALIAALAGVFMFGLGVLSPFWLKAEQTLSMLQGKPIEFIARGVFWLTGAYLLAVLQRYLGDHAEDAERAAAPKEAPPVPKPLHYAGSDESWDTIVKSAREWEDEIRFQRTWSQGWSGALKLPVGMEAGVNQALSWSRRQMSLPELTRAYTQFLSDVATHMVVVIAIDELDKISSDQKAHEFLNEIKAIFGIERCFYLLSISDSAMGSFARRGLPVRDAFDSALDEVVRVDYLTHETAHDLISRRIVRFPLPFVSFCHCLSGGLPRDVIRACRDVFDAAEKINARELNAVIRAVLADDLQQKIAATVTAVSHSNGDDEATTILERLGALRTTQVEPAALLADYADILDSAAATKSPACRSVAIDLATYYLYAATLIEIFDASIAADAWADGSFAARFEDLAALRRRLEIDSEAIRRELLALRARLSFTAARAPVARPVTVPKPRRYPRLTVRESHL